jgi:hypothetical protein
MILLFNHCLAIFLDPGKQVEVDKGYHGHPDKIKCPDNADNPRENLAMKARVRSRHETLNGRLKNWGILAEAYCHDISKHGDVFRACAVITQLMIQNGEPLFSVEYSDL